MRTDYPKVTIGVVVYNQEEFIAPCLESIRLQDYPNLELLISDDASTDGTFAAIEAYARAHPGFITLMHRQQDNLGISLNCNFVLDRATGEYVTIFSGDDLMLPGKIHAQVAALEQAPEAVLCFSNMEWFWSDSGKKICNHFGWLQRPSLDLADLIEDFSLPTPTLLIRRALMGDVRYRQDLPYLSDFYFVVELMQRGPALYLPRILVRYRKHKGSVTLKKYFHEDRQRLLALLSENLSPRYGHAVERYRHVVRYAKIMSLIQEGRKAAAIRDLWILLPETLRSPKWMARLGAILVNLLRSK